MSEEFKPNGKKLSRKRLIGPAPLLPFKILSLLLYGNFSCVEWRGNQVMIGIYAFCKLHGIHSHRFVDYMEYLEETGFIAHLSFNQGYMVCTVNVPAKFRGTLSEFMKEEVDAFKVRAKRN